MYLKFNKILHSFRVFNFKNGIIWEMVFFYLKIGAKGCKKIIKKQVKNRKKTSRKYVDFES